MTRPPYSFCTGSQTALVRKPRPYRSMAGQAPTTREPRIPNSKAKVSKAPALADQANNRSAQRLRARIWSGLGCFMSRPELRTGTGGVAGTAESVEDMGLDSSAAGQAGHRMAPPLAQPGLTCRRQACRRRHAPVPRISQWPASPRQAWARSRGHRRSCHRSCRPSRRT